MTIFLASTDSALCGFIAATNIETIYSEWSCNSSGLTVTDPCGDVQWPGITCLGQSGLSFITLSRIGLRGTKASHLNVCKSNSSCFLFLRYIGVIFGRSDIASSPKL